MRQDHQRLVFESETKKAILNPENGVSVAGTGLKSWREVLRPHEDVATGNYSASEFAADLYMVSQNEGSSEYVEPIEFFRRTYLTEGLKILPVSVRVRLGALNEWFKKATLSVIFLI